METTKSITKPMAAIGVWEYWLVNGQVYRNLVADRAYMLPEGIPANARWECSVDRFKRSYR